MLYAALKALHLLAVVLWVGGMAFVVFFLRPALPTLAPADRLKLMREVLRRFFAAVAAAVLLVLASGAWMLDQAARAAARAGGGFTWPLDWGAMTLIGLAMAAIFGVIRLVLYPRFARALEGGDAPSAVAVLARIRAWVLVNLALGVAVIVVAVVL